MYFSRTRTSRIQIIPLICGSSIVSLRTWYFVKLFLLWVSFKGQKKKIRTYNWNRISSSHNYNVSSSYSCKWYINGKFRLLLWSWNVFHGIEVNIGYYFMTTSLLDVSNSLKPEWILGLPYEGENRMVNSWPQHHCGRVLNSYAHASRLGRQIYIFRWYQ